MPELPPRHRAQLPDSAFAYVDSRGRRRLPIHDASHVRNALSRFNQVIFESETARERARARLLKAAQRHGILPIGFITGQLRATGPRTLPTGHVTFLMSDIEGSTALLARLGEVYAGLLADARRLHRTAIRRGGGREVDARADEYLAVFKQAPDALEAAIGIQRALRDHGWPDDAAIRVRIGLHSGRPTLTDAGYVGLAVHTVARVATLGHGGQILVSHATVRALGAEPPPEMNLLDLGPVRLRGLPEPERLYQLTLADLLADFPPLRLNPTAD